MKPGFWSSFHNQALLPANKSSSIGINYHGRFGIRELGTRTAGIIIPVEKAALGFIYSNFGYSDLARHSAGIACGMRLSKKISAGIQSDFFAEKTAGNYRERRSLSFEAGIIIKPLEKVSIGIHLFNPLPNSLRKSYLPSLARAGVGIWLNNELFVSTEVEMRTQHNLNIKSGFEYLPAKNLIIRGGFNSENNSFTFGLGYIIKSAQLDLGFTTHEKLGITSSSSITFVLDKKQTPE
jgi:hypothetical protein